MSSVRAELRISGLVQGVGFRYFCHYTARNLSLTGWVKNEADGTVRSVVEGERSAVEALIADVKIGCRSSRVSDVAIQWAEFAGEFNDFEIRR
ncbi:MAG: acylphosphatase [bacterium]|nr:acylphosphatase [bacterium]